MDTVSGSDVATAASEVSAPPAGAAGAPAGPADPEFGVVDPFGTSRRAGRIGDDTPLPPRELSPATHRPSTAPPASGGVLWSPGAKSHLPQPEADEEAVLRAELVLELRRLRSEAKAREMAAAGMGVTM